MATIKERAIEKYCTHCGARTMYGCTPDKSPCTYVKEYIKIATEQKIIDEDHLREVKEIVKEKAFQWICESITLYVTYNEEDGYIIDYDEMRKDFFKEMEE